jgi:hypothetical protein
VQADRAAQLVVVAAIAVVVAFGLKCGLFVAAAADAYGYVSQADLWIKGDLVVHQPYGKAMTWPNASDSLAPLGYRPHTRNPEDKDIVPVYSPGVPLLMALFKIVGGAQAVYFVVPLLGGLAVWATYLMGASLAGPIVGAAAAVLLAASPTFLFEVVAPASDVACTAWWALGLALLMSERRWSVFAAGLSIGLAILTRPNLVPLAALPAAMLVWHAVKDRSAGWVNLILFAAGSIPASIVVALIDNHLYGSPLATGYGPFHSLYSWTFLKTNLARYPRWVLDTESIIVVLALAAPIVLRSDPSRPASRSSPRILAIVWLAFCGGVLLSYLFYLPFEEWWYVRFLMPALPPLLALAAAVLWTIAAPLDRLLSGAQRLVVAAAIAAVAWHGVSFSIQRGVHLQWIAEQRYKIAGRYVAANLPERAVLVCMQHSGAARFYSGRINVRYDVIAPRDLDLVVDRLRQLGYVPYLLLDDWEEPQFKQRFAGRTPLANLDWPPIAQFKNVRIYDFADRKQR